MRNRERYKFYAFKLAGICIAIFVLQVLFEGFSELFVLNQSAWIQVWRFVSAVFLHGGIGHLVYNMFALLLFGGILEKVIGGKKFLIVFFVSGIAANLISVNFYSSSLGASGAIFGIIGALVILKPGMTVWAFHLPMPMFLAGVIWAIGDIMGIFMPSNVANIAHLAGMAAGMVFGIMFRGKDREIGRKPGEIVINERSMRMWEDVHMR